MDQEAFFSMYDVHYAKKIMVGLMAHSFCWDTSDICWFNSEGENFWQQEYICILADFIDEELGLREEVTCLCSHVWVAFGAEDVHGLEVTEHGSLRSIFMAIGKHYQCIAIRWCGRKVMLTGCGWEMGRADRRDTRLISCIYEIYLRLTILLKVA